MRRAGYAEVAPYIAVPDGTLRSMVSRRLVPHIRISPRVVVFDLDEIDAWIEERRQAELTREAFAKVRADRQARKANCEQFGFAGAERGEISPVDRARLAPAFSRRSVKP